MTHTTLIHALTITVRLSQPEPDVYLAQAHSDDGRTAIIESSESLYEAGAYAVARLTVDTPAALRS